MLVFHGFDRCAYLYMYVYLELDPSSGSLGNYQHKIPSSKHAITWYNENGVHRIVHLGFQCRISSRCQKLSFYFGSIIVVIENARNRRLVSIPFVGYRCRMDYRGIYLFERKQWHIYIFFSSSRGFLLYPRFFSVYTGFCCHFGTF